MPVKPGYLTTEFWTNVLVQLLNVAIQVATLFGHSFNGSTLQPLIPVAALVAAGIAQAYYAHSRAVVKASPSPVAVPLPPAPSGPALPPSTPPTPVSVPEGLPGPSGAKTAARRPRT